jgi:ABC-type proline/glycine betaine transport system ATPase subunit
MPKARRDEGKPNQLRNHMAAMFTDDDLARIAVVMGRYGMGKSAALRYLTRTALDVEEAKHRRRK